MSGFRMEEGEGAEQSPVQSPTLQRAAQLSTGELSRALMATVGDLSTTVAQTSAQQAQTTQHMHAVAEYSAQRPHEAGGALNFVASQRGLMDRER